MTRLTAIVLILAATLGSSFAWAHDLPPTTPHEADREINQLDVKLYEVTLEKGESISFSRDGVKSVAIDEARFVKASIIDDDRFELTACQPGKAVIRLFWTNKEDFESTHESRHGVEMFITTIIVNVQSSQGV